jgi:hypothetical protein
MVIPSISAMVTTACCRALHRAQRWYNPQALGATHQVKAGVRAKALQLSEQKPKTFTPALDHFRLTRFGWEHRKAGYRGERRRKKTHKGSLLSRQIETLNRRDLRTMRLYFPHMHLRERLSPVDTNVNLRTERELIGRRIG